MNTIIENIVSVLNSGGIVIYPTDTAFGVGCRIDNIQAVDRLFAIRKRARSKATPILVSSIEMATQYFDTPSEIVHTLMHTYWPGVLTIVYYCKKDKMYSPIRGGTDTIGIRMPNHADLLEVIARVGVPIIGCSANISGGKTPHDASDLDPELVRLVDLVMNGDCKHTTASTVVDCTKDVIKVLRQGAIVLPE